jgi:putative oxidoreductase
VDFRTPTQPPSVAEIDTALLLLRIASSLAFLYHGSAILFGVFDGPGPERFAASMQMPTVVGYLVGLAQFGGGVAVLTGVFIRVGTGCIMLVMLGAIFLVHLPNGYDVGKGGMEYALTQFLIAGALFLTGAGSYSLDRWLPGRLRKL